jgi:hypothetical protein
VSRTSYMPISLCGRFRPTRASKLAGRIGIEPEDDWVPATTSPLLKTSKSYGSISRDLSGSVLR